MIFKLRLEEIAGLALLAIVVALQLAACGPPKEQSINPQKMGDRNSRSIDDFVFLKSGLRYDEIKKRVGPADEDVGFGAWVYKYKLKDGSYLLLGFISLDHLRTVQRIYPNGTEKWIVAPPQK